MSTAESFCLQKAEELKIKTNEQLLFSCVPKVASIIKAELIKTYDPNAIPDGELSAASRRWLAQMQTQTTQTQQTSEVTAQGEQTQAMPDSTPKNAATAADSTASGNSYQVYYRYFLKLDILKCLIHWSLGSHYGERKAIHHYD